MYRLSFIFWQNCLVAIKEFLFTASINKNYFGEELVISILKL